jgi:hypothetical protein
VVVVGIEEQLAEMEGRIVQLNIMIAGCTERAESAAARAEMAAARAEVAVVQTQQTLDIAEEASATAVMAATTATIAVEEVIEEVIEEDGRGDTTTTTEELSTEQGEESKVPVLPGHSGEEATGEEPGVHPEQPKIIEPEPEHREHRAKRSKPNKLGFKRGT